MGHSSLATTERYLHLVTEDLADALADAYPAPAPTGPPPAEPEADAVQPPRLRVIGGGKTA